MQVLNKFVRSEKGSAMLLVFCVILVLTSLGVMALITSLANVQMGAKYSKWTKEYYYLDQQIENVLQNQIDSILEKAENYARDYMAKETYRNATDTNLGNAQSFFYNKWNESVNHPSLIDTIDNNGDTIKALDPVLYSNKLKDYVPDAFKRMYYYQVAKELKSTSDGSITVVDNKNYEDIQSGDDTKWNEYEPNENDITVKIQVYDTIGNKKVTAQINIIPPKYESLQQTRYVPVKGNPIWANAITSGGSIVFQGTGTSAKIYGDVYSSLSSLASEAVINEGNSIGVVSKDGAQIDIYGNAYSRGDVHVVDGSGKINIHKYAQGFKTGYKRSMYGNDVFFEKSRIEMTSSEEQIDYYIEGNLNGAKKFIFNDNTTGDNVIGGGNVYCNNLSVEKDGSNAQIIVERNVWTKDDIQIDGEGSSIAVNGNYIGISQNENVYNDPNASSCIINNNVDGNSSIAINGYFVVPGVAYLKFDKREPIGDLFFQTAESVSAKAAPIFAGYGRDIDGDITDFIKYTVVKKTAGDTDEELDYYLINTSDFTQKVFHFIRNIDLLRRDKQQGEDHVFKTNIHANTQVVEGYALGAVVLKKNNEDYNVYWTDETIDSLSGYAGISEYSLYFADYNIVKGALQRILKMKTRQLGTDRTEDIDKYVNKNVIKSLSPTERENNSIIFLSGTQNIFSLSEYKSGIIYSEGNLEISGNGKFCGTIICEGDVTITGSPEIYYDESVIDNILKNNTSAINFFKPGEMGTTLFHAAYETKSISSAQRNFVKRYKIVEWIEGSD